MSKQDVAIRRILLKQNERLLNLLEIHAGAGAGTRSDPSFLGQALNRMQQTGVTKKKKKLTKKQLQALAKGRAKLKQMNS